MADLSPGSLVKVTNKSNRPLTIQWANRPYKLEPSKPTYVPVEAATLWFGDARSTSATQSYQTEGGGLVFIPDRESEVRRLCVKYGHQSGNEIDFLTKQGDQKDNVVPLVEVTTVDDESLPTVLSDPHGDNVTPASTTVSEQADLRAIIEAQQKQIDALRSQFMANRPDNSPVLELGDNDELPEDDSIFQGEKTPPSDVAPLDLNP